MTSYVGALLFNTVTSTVVDKLIAEAGRRLLALLNSTSRAESHAKGALGVAGSMAVDARMTNSTTARRASSTFATTAAFSVWQWPLPYWRAS